MGQDGDSGDREPDQAGAGSCQGELRAYAGQKKRRKAFLQTFIFTFLQAVNSMFIPAPPCCAVLALGLHGDTVPA